MTEPGLLQRKSTFKIVQLTDTHLFSDDEHEIHGVKSNLTFNAIINKLQKEDRCK